jgi:RNA polymerase sigma factor (TIGR02999 family)
MDPGFDRSSATPGPPPDITRELTLAAKGDPEAAQRVWVSLYEELRRLAHWKLSGERPGHTLSTTALVNEAYVKLARSEGAPATNRSHFLAVAARAMRQILVDHARTRGRQKRGGGRAALPLNDAEGTSLPLNPTPDPDLLLAVDEALSILSEHHPRLGRVVELRFFAGLTSEECAGVLGVSTRTVERDWIRARTYLYSLLGDVAAST